MTWISFKTLYNMWKWWWYAYTLLWLKGMACRPNTHRPSFHVNMVGLEKTTQRSNSSRFPWDLDVEMMDEDEEEFELWLQQAMASGLFCETSKRRKSWSPFKLTKKQSRRTSTWGNTHIDFKWRDQQQWGSIALYALFSTSAMWIWRKTLKGTTF